MSVLSFWCGIAGLIATLIFGALSIYIAKSRKYPGAITYIEEQSIGLFDSLVKNFSQISIQYEGKNINEQIVLLKGYFINTGNIDIKKSMVEDSLKVLLPKEFIWLNAKIVEGTAGNKADIKLINQNQLELDLGLFKKDEYLRFEALVEVPLGNEKNVPPSVLVSKELFFTHRIADTSQVESETNDLKLPKLSSRKYIYNLIMQIIFIVYFITMLFAVLHDNKMRAGLHYIIKTPKNDLREVSVTPLLDSSFIVTSVDKKTIQRIKINDFFNHYLVSTKVYSDDTKILGVSIELSLNYILVVVMFAASIIFFAQNLSFLRDYSRTKKIRRILKRLD